MNEFRFRQRDRLQERQTHHSSGGGIQSLLSAERQLLQSISSCAPLPEVLNGICCALDGQVGDVVSLISLTGEEAGEPAANSVNPALFGLCTFCSEDIFAKDDELLGSLEMYCSVPRSPSASELQLIERAKCLAAIAIKNQNETSLDGICRTHRRRPVRGFALKSLVSLN